MSVTLPAYGSTPLSAMTVLTKSFLRFPSPPTVSACGGSSGLPSGSWIPRAVRKSRTPFEAGLPIHIEPVVRGDLEGTKGFASLGCTLLQVRVKHLFPTRRVDAGGVRDHAVEVEEDGVVLVAGDGARHGSPPLRELRFGCSHNGFWGKAEFVL